MEGSDTKGSLANSSWKPGDWKLGKLCLRTAAVEAPYQATPLPDHAPDQRNPRGTDNAQPGEQREGHLGRRRKERYASWLLRIQALELRAAMENSDPADDANMDAFLEKFQSQPYRGGFHEDQWEEVGGPGGSAGVGVWFSCLDRCQRTSDCLLSATSLEVLRV